MRDHWEGDPFWKNVITRKLLHPLQTLQEFKMKRSGMKWELRQQAKVARACNAGQDPRGCREYRAELAAESVAETACMDSLRTMLTDPHEWDMLLDNEAGAMTVHGRSLAFRMITRAGGSLEQLLMHPHRGYPFKFFAYLNTPSWRTK